MSRWFFVFLLLGLSTSAFADGLFTVIFSDKAIKVDAMGAQVYMHTGLSIYAGENIDVMSTGMVGLMHKNGKTIELNKYGRYSTDSLLQMVSNESSPVSVLLLPFLEKRIVKYVGTNRYAYDYPGTRVYALLNTKVIPGNITVCWQSVRRTSSCVVSLTNEHDEVFFEGTTADSCIRIDLSKLDLSNLDLNLPRDREFEFSMHDELNPKNFIVDHVFIEFLDEKGVQRIGTGETELNKVNPPTSIVNLLLLAALYESEDLYLNTIDKYQAAIMLNPELEDLRLLYDGFLYRNSLVP
jgi:hypothetical protein